MHSQFWSEDFKGWDYLADVGIGGKIIMDLDNVGCDSVN
jgi:hypothetical protein